MTAPVWDGVAASHRMDHLQYAEDEKWRAPEAYVRVWDKFMQEKGPERSYLDLEFAEKKNVATALTMSLPKSTAHYDHFFRNPDGEDAMIPITADTEGHRWSGKVTRVALVKDAQGIETVEVEAISDWNHVATTCLWASPLAPLLAQFPRHDIRIGPTMSCCASWLAMNISRLQMGWWTGTKKYKGAPAEWDDYGASMWPIVVVPVNLYRDTSKWCGGAARFDMASPFIDDFLKDAGIMLQVTMFIPEEDEQPAPEWFYLDRPTIVMKFVDKSNTTGPTGTLFDGILSFFEGFLDDGTTPIRFPQLDSPLEYENAYSSGPLGTKRNFPWIWYREGEYSGIGEAELAIHKPMATNILVGGRSPSYVNAAIEIAIKNLLSWIGLLIGIPGLDALYRGQLDDVFFAFGMAQDQGRVQRAGPFAWREHFVTGSEKAFTIDGVMAMLQGLHDTRGYTSKKVTIRDRAPFIFGLHMGIGDQIGFEVGDLLFTDYITEAVFRDDRKTASAWTLTIGDGSDEEDSLVKNWNRLGQVMQVVSTLSKDVGMEADFFGLF